MFLAYFDEAGDDGYPKTSSDLFVLTSIYLHHKNWQDEYRKIHHFRQALKNEWNLPVKTEFHARPFLLGKNPFHKYKINDKNKLAIFSEIIELINQLKLKSISVVINKSKIKAKNYAVLDRALTYNIQRIENDLTKTNPDTKFVAIVDEGRVGKMRRTARKLQRINFIPSKYSQKPYRKEIESLIEDPLPKPSEESYFIQICDAIAFLVYLYVNKVYNKKEWRTRLEKFLTLDFVYEQLEKLKSVLNLKASRNDPYGIVIYPR